MDKRILLLIVLFFAGSLAFFVYRKFFYQHAGISYEIRPRSMMIHVGDSISFQDKTEQANRWKWDFGDGEYSAEQSGNHPYLQAGHYPIRVSVYGPFGMIHDERSVLEVLPAENMVPVHPEIVGSGSVQVDEAISFESNVVAESYVWEVVGEPGLYGKDGQGRTVAFTFTKPGPKVISVKLHNPDTTLMKTVIVYSGAAKEMPAVVVPHGKPATVHTHSYKPENKKHKEDDEFWRKLNEKEGVDVTPKK